MMTRTRTWKVALVMGLALCHLSLGAQAQEDEGRRKQAKQHNKLGLQYVDQGKFKAAIGEFEKAYRAEPRAKYLFNIGRAYELLERLRDALAYYERVKAESKSEKRRTKAQGRIDFVRGQMPVLTVVVAQPGATVEVDGDTDLCRPGVPCLLDPRQHSVRVSCPGYRADTRRVKLSPEETAEERFNLVSLVTRGGVFWRSVAFPGLGQFHADNDDAGVTFFAGELVSLATLGTGLLLRSYYLGRRDETSGQAWNDWNTNARNAEWVALAGGAVAAVVWGVNIVHAAAMSLPEGGESSVWRLVPLGDDRSGGMAILVTF